ncbi:MAG: type IV pilus biogenesis/stability protein PilW [Magnetococcus sp. XQGC-1]
MKILGIEWRFRGAIALSFVLLLSACSAKYLDERSGESAVSSEKQELQKRASIRMQLAIGYYQQGQYKVALEEIRQALIIYPDLVDAYAVRAVIFMDMGERQLAEDNFLQAMKLSPNNVDVANNYGWFLCQNGRERQGLTYLDRVIKDPAYATPGKAYNNAGLCSLRLKDVSGAEKYFMQGFREDPGNPGINGNLAKIWYDRGDYDKANFYISRVIKLDVMTADVLWLAIKIERRRGDAAAVSNYSTQLRRRYPDSREFGLLQRGAFDE